MIHDMPDFGCQVAIHIEAVNDDVNLFALEMGIK